MISLQITFVVVFITLTSNPTQGQTGSDLCASTKTCSACISASANCSWCQDEILSQGLSSRCFRTSVDNNRLCQRVSNPNSNFSIGQNLNVSTEQVAPQSFNINLRPGESVTVSVNVRPAKDHPVDLYYLMDMSNSMKDDLEKLKTLAGSLADALKIRTKNTRVGFGTFVDKTTTPYVDLRTINNPCGARSPCAPPYSFKNALPLTGNTDDFVAKVNKEEISGNVDFPEGGMDALMQVIVCGQEIGWETNTNARARRIVVLASDAGFHFAGDGKLGGAVVPNDGLCHLNASGLYTEALIQDYPSIGHLNEKLKAYDILPVFAIAGSFRKNYENLAGQIDALRVAALDANSQNVVQLIGNIYDEIVSTVRPVIPTHPGITIDAVANCNLQPNSTRSQIPGGCQDVQLGETVTFNFKISADTCSSIEANKNIRIRFPGFNDFDITLNPVCECECASSPMSNSSLCAGGKLSCGTCECNSGKFGDRCECDRSDEDIGLGCGPANATADFVPCNGPTNGDCICGQCVCREIFIGDQCQCNKLACNHDTAGNLCGGSDKGRCVCGTDALIPVCVCNPGYTGTACECSLSLDTCKDQLADDKVCNGQGKCSCGKCICEEGFIGDYCETCATQECLNFNYCDLKKDCVECSAFGSGPLTLTCSSNCSDTNVTKIAPLNEAESVTYQINKRNADPCLVQAEQKPDQQDCKFKFYYALAADGSLEPIHVESELRCSSTESFKYYPLVLGLVFGLLALVLIPLLLWKLITMYFDGLEYKKFVQEQQSAKYQKGVNPLYKTPEQKTANPAYGKA
ncbi:integrin beta-1-like [Oscarella lobularis]|uniref:integrin beta-1-like n=1 Tax=Oscarella lobularis TaxID=121494 RepID=UPI00331425F5